MINTKQTFEILNDFDVNNISKLKIKEFLISGQEDEAAIMIQSIVSELGKNHFESQLLRHYIIMHIYIDCRTFTDSIGVSKTEFEKSCGGPVVLPQNANNVETTISYLTRLLEQCIDMRCNAFSKTSGDIIKQAKEHILNNLNQSMI